VHGKPEPGRDTTGAIAEGALRHQSGRRSWPLLLARQTRCQVSSRFQWRMRHHRFADRPEGISNYFDWVRLMDTEHLPELTPPFKQGTRRMLVTTLLYFLYLAPSCSAPCHYLAPTPHGTACLI